MTNLILGLAVGVAFGFIIHRTGASQYENVVNTLRLKDLTVLKFMATAIAVGMVGVYALQAFGLGHFSIKTTYILGVGLGGLIFGIGFALSGYCPGTVMCALGEGKKDALFTLLGGLVGALAYSLVYQPLKPLLIDPLNYGKLTFVDMIPLPHFVTALIFAGLLALVIGLLPKPNRAQ